MQTPTGEYRIAEVTPADVAMRIKQGESLKVIDVREKHEVEEGMIEGALHVPLADLLDKYREWEPDEELIFVCRSGRRSLVACQVLTLAGYQNVKNLVGGMNAWRV